MSCRVRVIKNFVVSCHVKQKHDTMNRFATLSFEFRMMIGSNLLD